MRYVRWGSGCDAARCMDFKYLDVLLSWCLPGVADAECVIQELACTEDTKKFSLSSGNTLSSFIVAQSSLNQHSVALVHSIKSFELAVNTKQATSTVQDMVICC